MGSMLPYIAAPWILWVWVKFPLLVGVTGVTMVLGHTAELFYYLAHGQLLVI